MATDTGSYARSVDFPPKNTFTVTVCMCLRELVVMVTKMMVYVTEVKPLLVNERV